MLDLLPNIDQVSFSMLYAYGLLIAWSFVFRLVVSCDPGFSSIADFGNQGSVNDLNHLTECPCTPVLVSALTCASERAHLC